jgi:hypothetical protein
MGPPACAATKSAYQAVDCCSDPHQPIINILKETLRVSDPDIGLVITQDDYANITLFADETYHEPLETINYLRDEYVEPNLDHCMDGLQKSKEHCYPKILTGQSFAFGPNYIREDQQVSYTLHQDNKYTNTFEMSHDVNGRYRAVGAEAFGTYADTFNDANNWFSYEYAIKNRYFARRPNGRLYLKQMSAAQIAQYGDCYHAIRPTSYEFLLDPELFGPGPIAAIKFWNSKYCMKDGVLSNPVDYVHHFDGVRWLDKKMVYYVKPRPPLPAYEAYKGAVFAQAVINGDLPVDRFHRAPPPVMNDMFAMFCPTGCSLCPCSMSVWANNTVARKEFYDSMQPFVTSYGLRYADGFVV